MFATDGSGMAGQLVWTNWQATADTLDDDELVHASALARSGAKQIWLSMKESVRYMDGPPPVFDIGVSRLKIAEDEVMGSANEQEVDDDAKMEI